MNEFITAFKQVATEILKNCPQDKYEWISEPDKPKETLKICKLDDNGFDIRLECESYGLYPFAEGWSGSPWDVTMSPIEEFKKEVNSFIRSILSSKSQLCVKYTNGKPYKWNLKYSLNDKNHNEEVGLTLYNYFGDKNERCFSNTHLETNKI